MKTHVPGRLPLALACALLLAGCAAEMAYREGRRLIDEGRVAEGVGELERATKEAPGDVKYRTAYFRQREAQVNLLLTRADALRANGQFEAADDAYRQALQMLPDYPRALTGLEANRMAKAHALQLEKAEALLEKGDAEGALALVRTVLVENARHPVARQMQRRAEEKKAAEGGMSPGLRSSLKQPITLELRDASLKAVLELISRTANINFIVDRDVRTDIKTTVFVKNVTIEDVLQFVLVVNQLDRKVLNENSLLIYPNTPAKAKDYVDLTVRSFYVVNTDVKQMAGTIKTLLKAKDVTVDDKLNMIVVRDTPETVRMVEKLIALHDRAEPEVTLAVEVLEVSSGRLQEIGIRYPGQVAYSVAGAAGIPGQLALNEFKARSSEMVTMSLGDPLLVLNLRAQDGGSKLLANPRIRVKNREKAKIHIGDRVPVITSTSTSTGFVSESVNYLDVGLKLDVEPNVYLDGEVGIRVGLEVSNIVNEIASKSGSLTYRVGTRNASTVLRLKDGETQILAGLINDEERNSADKIPGLGDLPVVGRLFSSHKDTRNKTEIVLLITPYVVRNIEQPASTTAEFSSGTESAVGAQPMQLRQARPAPLPLPAPAPRPVPLPAAPAGGAR